MSLFEATTPQLVEEIIYRFKHRTVRYFAGWQTEALVYELAYRARER